MASPASIITPPTGKPCDSDMDCGSDTDYEDVEVEEEVEVEVEISDQEDEIGEDVTPIRQENREDGNQTMELEEKEQIKTGYVTQGKHVSNSLTDMSTKQKIAADVNISESSEKEELHVTGARTSRDTNLKAPYYDSGELNHEKRTPVEEFTTGFVVPGTFRQKDNGTLSVMAEANRNSVEAVPDVRQMSSRLPVPLTRFRDHPSTSALDREKKKLKIACEFHAKGWCIRGNSCTFLHVKDGLEAVGKRSDVLREESSSGCIPSQQSGKNQKLNCENEKLVLHKDYMIESVPLQAGRGSFGHNLHLDKYSYSSAPFVEGNSNENSVYHGNFSGGPFTSHDNHYNTRISSGMTLEESITKNSEIVRSDPRSAELPCTHPRHPLSFGSASWNTNAFGTQDLLQRGLELRASISSSLQQSISPVPCSEPKSLSQDHINGDTKPGKYKPMYSDWEPSVPFRPSHFITQNLLLKENLYDPVRESIVQENVTAGQVKFSHSDEGSSVKNINMQSNNPVEEEKHLDLVHVGVTPKDNILSSSCDEKVTIDKTTQKAITSIGGSGKNDETSLDSKRDDQLLSESKAFKYFHFALVEFVKELVRPTWQEGRLSRDAHNLIVKSSVGKVLGTLQPDQIPRTGESIKSYLSSSQPKLAKLVEAYIKKYGKS